MQTEREARKYSKKRMKIRILISLGIGLKVAYNLKFPNSGLPLADLFLVTHLSLVESSELAGSR